MELEHDLISDAVQQTQGHLPLSFLSHYGVRHSGAVWAGGDAHYTLHITH